MKHKWSLSLFSITLLLLWLGGCGEDIGATHYNSDEIARLKAKLDNSKAQKFSFVVMGDNRDGDEIFKSFISEINKMNPAPLFIVDSGDLVPRGTSSAYKHFLDMISQAKPSFLCLPGNHDYRSGGKKLYTKIFGQPNYYFELWDFRFIMLDNAGEFDDVQINWLAKLLADGKKCFIFMHRPPPLGRWAEHSFSQNSATFLKLIKKENNILACFFGHIHGYGEAEYNGVKLFISAGAGAPFHRIIEPVHNYMLIKAKKDGEWSYEVIKKK